MKKLNVFFSLVLSLSLLMGLSSNTLAMDDVDDKERKPVIIIEENEIIPEAIAGEAFDFTIKYTNDSIHTAYNLKITPILENTPFVYEKPIVFERENSFKGRKTDSASFNFKIKDTATLGVYAVKFKIEYENVNEETGSVERVAYFKVIKEKVKPIIVINNISTGEAGVYSNSKFPLSFSILNNGEVDANNVEIKLTGLSANSFMAVDSNDYRYVGELKSGASIPVSFAMFATESVNKGINTIGLEIKYKDSERNDLSVEKTIYILDVKSENEKEDEDGTTAKPKIIISSYSTNPNTIVAGDTFNFNFTFKNTSKDKRLRNMKITITSSEGAFIITKGSNTFYIENLEKETELTKSIGLKAKQDLTSNSYPVIITFDYEDYAGNSYTADEKINIPVTEYSKLVINSVYVEEGYKDSIARLSFEYVNMGKATISNLTASVEGDYSPNQAMNYIGNLTTGTSDYYDIEVIPMISGQNKGTLILSFEDSSGKTIDVRKDFEGFAMEMQEPSVPVDPGYEEPYYPIEENQNQVGVWTIILWGAGTLVVSFFVTKLITTKIIRKKLEDEI